MSSHAAEIEQAQRFEFGKNWARFLALINDERVVAAEESLCAMLEVKSLRGKSFLDVGSGSGLSSLAAARLGATRIHSFDFDPQCVACTRELKRRYFPGLETWTIEEGSVLDRGYLSTLGESDVVYAWGVLHHSGQMWNALESVIPLVARAGKLFLAIYNDQGVVSRYWKTVKTFYVKGLLSRAFIVSVFVPYFVIRGLAADVLRLKNPFSRYREYSRTRGMSVVRDWIDWLGGYPFEYAKPEEIFDFCRKRGFNLIKLKTKGGTLGNNEYVFIKCAD